MSSLPSYTFLQDAYYYGKNLPKLAGNALELVRLVDSSGCAAAVDLERIVACDPSLSAGVLRMANSALFGGLVPVASIPGAVMRLGLSSVRSIALSMAVTAMVGGHTPAFDAARFARHNVFVGFLARYFYARRKAVELFTSTWTADELFAASILHDLPVALLSRVSPAAFEAVADHAWKTGATFRTAFADLYGSSLGSLGRIAVDAWQLPSLFGETTEFMEMPLDHGHEQIPLGCLHLADDYANRNGWSLETWDTHTKIDPAIVELIGLSDDDVSAGLEMVGRHSEAFLAASAKSAA